MATVASTALFRLAPACDQCPMLTAAALASSHHAVLSFDSPVPRVGLDPWATWAALGAGSTGVAVRIEHGIVRRLALARIAPDKISQQSAAAMAAAHILDTGPGLRVLDMCAAPGGKTTHIASMMNDDGEVIAIDITAKKVGPAPCTRLLQCRLYCLLHCLLQCRVYCLLHCLLQCRLYCLLHCLAYCSAGRSACCTAYCTAYPL